MAIRPATYDESKPLFDPERPSISPGSRYLGSAATDPHTQGGFSDFFIVRADHVAVLPDGLPLDRAVLAEPLAVALHALGRAGSVDGKAVLVSGAGPIGLLAARAAVLRGAATVAVTDVLDRPLALATALGAEAVVNVSRNRVPAQRFDVVIEASGVPAATTTALAAVTSGGIVVQVGMLPGGSREYSLAELVSREIDLRGAFRFNGELDQAIDLLAADPLFQSIVTHHFSADDAVGAFDVAADPATSSKVVLRFGPE